MIFQQFTQNTLRPIHFALIVAAMTVLFGYDLGTLFVNLQYVTDFYILDENEVDVVFGAYVLGAILGAALGCGLCSGSGRRISIIGGASLGMASSLASVFAPSFSIFLCAQLILGLSFSLFVLSALIYICEIALPGNRGFCSCFVPIAFLLGSEIAILTPDWLPRGDGFPLFLGLLTLHFAAICMAIIKLPESPRWLALSGLSDAALSVLFNLRNDMGIAARELAGVNECCRNEERGAELFLQNNHFRKLIWLLLSLALCLQLSGVIIIPYALSDLVIKTSFSEYLFVFSYSYNLLKASFTVALFGAISAVFTVDRCGRRLPLLISAIVSSITLLILSFISYGEIKFLGVIFISTLIILFIYSSSVFFCCFLAVLVCELIPLRGREFGLALVLVVACVAILLGLQMFVDIITKVDFKGLFFIQFIFAALLVYITYNFVPNTANSAIENIENRLFNGRDLVNLGNKTKP